jgi:hypothetical protein
MNELLDFPTSYVPSTEELERLDAMQRQWKLWRVELVREWDIKHFDYNRRMISKNIFHKGCRMNWKIFVNEEKEIYSKTK